MSSPPAILGLPKSTLRQPPISKPLGDGQMARVCFLRNELDIAVLNLALQQGLQPVLALLEGQGFHAQ